MVDQIGTEKMVATARTNLDPLFITGRLTLQEKVRLLVNNAAGIPRLGIQGYEWWSEALHGVSDVGPGTKFLPEFHGATQFPQVITTASTFNDTLWEEIGTYNNIKLEK
uniref:Uncharacterized protein n=1 Tax=Lactuca sativa TaxID=4236 RepID=A0A9R1V3N0_LACSA|nr:hypothetical protein LSAT_V11C600306040 [Lactuca sativa]